VVACAGLYLSLLHIKDVIQSLGRIGSEFTVVQDSFILALAESMTYDSKL
jgi:hypothetical protein